MRRAAKKDANHTRIVDALRGAGVSDTTPASCPQCGVAVRKPRSAGGRRFCNKACYDAYRAAQSIAQQMTCKVCGREFTTYEQTANTCGAACRAKYERVEVVCACCGVTFTTKRSHADRVRYCSAACVSTAYRSRMQGAANPNHRGDKPVKVCLECGESFRTYTRDRKYCSRGCADMARRRRPSSLDRNHPAIVQALRDVGASVIDTSDIGHGFPDLVVGFRGQNYLLEVKNLETAYGRKGLNPNQQRWSSEWAGSQPAIVRTVAEALAAVGVEVAS